MKNLMFTKDGTAQGVAKQRLIETLAQVDKRIIFDPYAENFVLGSSFIKLMGHKVCVWLTQKFAPGFHEHLIARTRFIDDEVNKGVNDGAEQYVILGAGYDLRAYRLDLPPSLQIFEVDQPEVQARKRAKLPNNLPNANNVVYVNIDFNHQSLSKQLLAAGFDQTKSTIFTLEGVSQYISKEALDATLQELAELSQGTHSTFIISYVDELLINDPIRCFGDGYHNAVKRAELIKGLAAKTGEPWQSFYTAEEMKNLLAQHGFIVQKNKSLEDLNAEYFTPVGRTLATDHIMKLEYFVMANK